MLLELMPEYCLLDISRGWVGCWARTYAKTWWEDDLKEGESMYNDYGDFIRNFLCLNSEYCVSDIMRAGIGYEIATNDGLYWERRIIEYNAELVDISNNSGEKKI